MRRQNAVTGTERLQAAVEKREMHRLVGAHGEPVTDEVRREVRSESSRNVEGKVDRANSICAKAWSKAIRPRSEPPRPRLGIRPGASSSGLAGRAGRSGICTSKRKASRPERH